ncbi:hypothetical protein Tco_0469123 [Tanacetum coccineum]
MLMSPSSRAISDTLSVIESSLISFKVPNLLVYENPGTDIQEKNKKKAKNKQIRARSGKDQVKSKSKVIHMKKIQLEGLKLPNLKLCVNKKNSVLFTDSRCFVLSPDFKLADESQVLLKVPRKNNMYSVDMKNIIPKECLTCLVAKATLEESMLWHRRKESKVAGHIYQGDSDTSQDYIVHATVEDGSLFDSSQRKLSNNATTTF